MYKNRHMVRFVFLNTTVPHKIDKDISNDIRVFIFYDKKELYQKKCVLKYILKTR